MEARLVEESARARETLERMRAAFDAQLAAERAENGRLQKRVAELSRGRDAAADRGGLLGVLQQTQSERRATHDKAAALVAYCKFQRARARNARRRFQRERRMRRRASRALAMRRPQLLKLVAHHQRVCAELRRLRTAQKGSRHCDAGADTGPQEEARLAEMRRAVSTADSDRAALVAVSRELGETRAALADAHAQIERGATQIHALERQLLHVRSAAESGSEELSGALAAAQARISALEQRLAAPAGADTDEREAAWLAERRALEAEVAAAAAIGRRAADAEQQMGVRRAELERERDDLAQRLRTCKEEHGRDRSAMDAAARAAAEEARRERDALAEKLRDAEERGAALGAQEARLRDAMDEVHVLTVHLSRTSKELEETRAAMRAAEERGARIGGECARAEEGLREAARRHEELRGRVREMEAQLEAAESRHGQTQRLLGDTTGRLNETSTQLAQAAAALEGARGELAGAQRDRATLLAAASRLSLVSHASDWSLSTATDSVRDAIRRRTCASLAHVRLLLDAGDRSMATLADLTAHCARMRRASAAMLGLLRREHARCVALGRRAAQADAHVRALEDELSDAYAYVRVRIREDALAGSGGGRDRRQMVQLLAHEERILRRLRERHAK